MPPEPLKQKAELPLIPGYRIEGIVGKGATGIVYRARQLSVDRVVALKVLHRELVGARSAELRLQREARTTARLAHPNIISAIDMGEVGGMWWYAMELVDGVSLAERLRDALLSEREALRLFIPLCDALEHAFEHGVVHRDIKPANVLIDRGGRALLVDLGLAFADDDPLLTKSGGTLGTPHYISPEQARDPSSADVQSDLWSLGATLYHAVCGRPPFAGDSVAEILSSVLYARIADPAQLAPHLSKGFVLVLRKCLTRDRKQRYLTPAELQSDLERIRERRAPRVNRAALDPVERDTRARRRNVAVGFLVLALTALSWFVLHEPDRPGGAAGDPRGAAPDPIERLARIAAEAPGQLSNALAEVAKLQSLRTLSAVELSRLEGVRRDLYMRLETELWSFKRDAEGRIERILAARDFDGAQAFVARGLREERSARIGSEELPRRLEEELEAWTAAQSARVRGARESAEADLRAAIDRAYDEHFLPRVDRLQAQGSWRDARDLLTTERFLEESQIDMRGIAPAVVQSALHGLRNRLDIRREKGLDAAWGKLDEELRQWVSQRVAELKIDLENRAVQDHDTVLRADWERELARRGLTIEQMPVGLLHLAHEDFEKGRRELSALDEQLAVQDAQRSYELLERETAELWRSRRYGEVARRYREVQDDPWRASVGERLRLRAREARLLEELLARAAQGVRDRNGQEVSLRVGTIVFVGRVEAGSDPLANGFRMTLVGGRVRALALRPPLTSGSPEPQVLGPEAIEKLAGLAPEGSAAGKPHDQLLSALFRARDGAPGEALAALNAGPLPRDEPLVADLEQRTRAALAEVVDSGGERRARAEERFLILRRELAGTGSRESKQRAIDDLLQGAPDVLGPDRLAELRRWRDELYSDARPWTREEFERSFAPDAVEIFGIDSSRVRMKFSMRGPKAGAFDPGAWEADGSGWSAARGARSDSDLLERPGPTLVLGEPYRAQGEIDVRLVLEQPSDAPPRLLLVSAGGFHVALSGPVEGRPARCVIDTKSEAEAVARARAGEGREFVGWKAGSRFELHVAVHRLRGTALVEVDRREIAAGQHLQPRDDAQAAVLMIRSWEPVRVLEATVEGTRR